VPAASRAAFRAGCHQDQRASLRVVPAACSGQDLRSEAETKGQRKRTFIETARRAQIMAVVVGTIAELGYGQASLARIAEGAGVSKGVTCCHFAGEDDLIRDVIADVAAKGEAFIRGRVIAVAVAAGRLRTWVESNLEFIGEHRKELLAFDEIAMASRGNKAVAPAVPAVLQGGVAAVQALLASGQAGGEFRKDFDLKVMAVVIRAAVDAVPPRLARGPGLGAMHYGRELASLFGLGIRCEGSDE
jgi:TetR/AcrR family fatty acid metabolism transcriptional regulator